MSGTSRAPGHSTGAAALALVARVGRGLEHPGAPWVAGGVAGLLTWWLFGGLAPLPWVYDESAYLLQAEIFASGRWAAAGRPLPEFFEQFHVFVTPLLVPKYPPGHALLLVPGVWLGLPGLVPVLATTLTAGLMFGWVRRLANAWVAGLAVLIWLTAPEELFIRPSYMSQVTSTLVWLLAWGALARWCARGRGRSLAAFAALAAVAVLIRPITAAALLLPAGAWILWQTVRRRVESGVQASGATADPPDAGARPASRLGPWRQLVAAIGVALPILAVAPMWSYATSGRAYPTPYSEYSRVYAPWNMPGFRVDERPALREETPALRKFRTEWLPLHRAHRLGRLPAIAMERLRGLAITFFGDGPLRWLLLGAFLLGLWRLGPELRFGLASFAALFLAHLWIAARPLWTVYYLEAFPVLATVTAIGAWRAAEWLAGRVKAPGAVGTPSDGGGRQLPLLRPQIAAGLVALGMLVSVPGTVDRLLRARVQQENARLVQTDLARVVASIPGKAIVFVASGPAHRPYESYVRNVPDLDRARVWIVQDRGDDNARLVALAPDRTAYRFDPGPGTVTRWSPPDP